MLVGMEVEQGAGHGEWHRDLSELRPAGLAEGGVSGGEEAQEEHEGCLRTRA